MMPPRGGDPRERQQAGRASRPAASRVRRRGGASGRAGSGSVKINGRGGSCPRGRCRRGLQVAVRESGGPYLVRRHDSRSEGGPDVRGVLVSTAGRVGHGLDCGWRRRVGRRLGAQGRPGAGCRMSINEARTRGAWCARAPLARARGGGAWEGNTAPVSKRRKALEPLIGEGAAKSRGRSRGRCCRVWRVQQLLGGPRIGGDQAVTAVARGERRRSVGAKQRGAWRAGTACREPS
jgi:hypothetical protein